MCKGNAKEHGNCYLGFEQYAALPAVFAVVTSPGAKKVEGFGFFDLEFSPFW